MIYFRKYGGNKHNNIKYTYLCLLKSKYIFMETLIIKIQEPKKAAMLVQLLKSMDFISSVDNFDDYLKAKEAFDDLNNFSSQTPLLELTMEDIISEIKTYRNEKKLYNH